MDVFDRLTALQEQMDALKHFFIDKAEGLTCGEADVVAQMYLDVNDGDAASTVLLAHALHDEEIEGDQHCELTDREKILAYLKEHFA